MNAGAPRSSVAERQLPLPELGAIAGLTPCVGVSLRAALLELTWDPCFAWTAQGTIVLWNSAAERLYGFTRGEAVGAKCRQLLQCDCAPPCEEVARIVLREGKWEGIIHRSTQSGGALVVECRLQAARLPGGECLFLETNRDATQRRRDERELQASEERFGRAFRNAPIGLVVCETDGGEFVDVNDAFLAIIGWPRKLVLGRNPVDLDVLPRRQELAQWRAQLRSSGNCRDREITIRTRKGCVRQALVDAQFVELHGRQFILAMIRDVTAARQAEKELRAAHEFTAQIISSADEGIAVVDDARVVRVWNHAMEQLLGVPGAQVLDRPADEVFNARDFPEYQTRINRALAGESVGPLDRFICLDNPPREIWVVSRIAPLLGRAGQPAGAILTMHDITERKRLERGMLDIVELEKQRISQDLHDELGQQLTAVSFLVDALCANANGSSPHLTQKLGEISGLLSHANASLRTVVRGLQPVSNQPTGLMDALHRLTIHERPSDGPRVRFECPQPVTLEDADVATQLFHIAREALTNARKHASARNIIVGLVKTRGELRLTVRDDGLGIASSRSPFASRGSGLRIMRHRCESIGGRFELTHLKPRGTCIRCRVRIPAPDDASS